MKRRNNGAPLLTRLLSHLGCSVHQHLCLLESDMSHIMVRRYRRRGQEKLKVRRVGPTPHLPASSSRDDRHQREINEPICFMISVVDCPRDFRINPRAIFCSRACPLLFSEGTFLALTSCTVASSIEFINIYLLKNLCFLCITILKS